ncbi:MAG: SRPBCC family protein [Sulfurimonadaceae bacterium]|jgi:ligand-binding SRPBCC domain-containing protein|nr:SRPBCC family protein [Sulfurimonadaceae bacterium]
MKKEIIYTSNINCSVEELFDFHTDSNNITKITPPNTKVELLNEDTTTYEGKIVRLKTTRLFVPTHWEVLIEKLDRPNILIDTAQRSPLKYWRHSHIFIQHDGYCELRDIIEYELPFGILNTLIDSLFKRDVIKMFTYRHVKTKEILEQQKK